MSDTHTKKSFRQIVNDKNLPLFSVITVTQNLIDQGRKNTFRIALECVQNQSFRNIEHIILDGASTDGSQNLIQELIDHYQKTDKPIKIRYKSETDRGLYDAMNKAVEIATGKYVLFLNSDDTLAGSDILARIVNLIDPSFPDYIYGTHIVINKNGIKHELSKTNHSAFLQRMPFCHNSMLVQKTIFKKLGGHDLDYFVSADYEFVFRMLTNGHKGMSTNFPISVFKNGGISSNVNAVADDHARFWGKFFSDNHISDKWSHADYVRWYKIGQIPLSACWIAYKKGRTVPILRKAALHSAMITLRRRIQPWRKWNNLK